MVKLSFGVAGPIRKAAAILSTQAHLRAQGARPASPVRTAPAAGTAAAAARPPRGGGPTFHGAAPRQWQVRPVKLQRKLFPRHHSVDLALHAPKTVMIDAS